MPMRRTVGYLLAAGALGLLPAPALSGQEHDHKLQTGFEAEINTTFIGTAPEVEELMARAQELVAGGDITAGVRLITRVLEQSPAGLVRNTDGLYLGVPDRCEEFLAGGGPELLRRYRVAVDAAAAAACRAGDGKGIVRVARTYALASAGDRYLFEAGSYLFASGHFAGALKCFAKVVRYFPGSDRRDAAAAGACLAAHMAGRAAEAGRWAAVLRDRAVPVVMAGRSMPVEEFLAGAALPPPVPAPAAPTVLREVWDVPLAAAGAPWLLAGDRLFVALPERRVIAALAAVSGYPEWEQPFPAANDAAAFFPCGPGLIGLLTQHEAGANLFQWFQQADTAPGAYLFLDAATGALRHTVTMVRPNAITVLDRRPVWMGASLYFGYRVFQKGGGTPEVFVARYDTTTGAVAWDTFICQGMGDHGGELVSAGGVLVYLTHRGIVACIEPYAGDIEWVFRYAQNSEWTRQGGRSERSDTLARLAAGDGFMVARPIDGITDITFDDAGTIKAMDHGAGLVNAVTAGTAVVLQYADRIAVRPAPGQPAVDRAGPAGMVAPGGDGWWFQSDGRSLGVAALGREFQSLIALSAPLTGLAGAGAFTALAAPERIIMLSHRPPEPAAVAPTDLLLEAGIAFRAREWDRGEALMEQFFGAVAAPNAGTGLAGQGRRCLAGARRARADWLFAAGHFDEARTWYERVLAGEGDPDRQVQLAWRLAECRRRMEDWAGVITAAQGILAGDRPGAPISADGRTVPARRYAVESIREAVARGGAALYEPYEQAARALLARGDQEGVLRLYPNSTVYRTALLAAAGRLEREGAFDRSMACLQELAASAPGEVGARKVLQGFYQRRGWLGAAAELSPPVAAAVPPAGRYPLVPAWAAGLDPKERDAGLDPAVRYLAADAEGIYYEYGGELEKRAVIDGRLLWRADPVKGWVGITLEMSVQPAGIRIARTFDGMPAAAAGLRVDDVITAVDGRPIGDQGSFVRMIMLRPPETTVTFQVNRGGESRAVAVVIGRRPAAYLQNDIRAATLFAGLVILEREWGLEGRSAVTGAPAWRVPIEGLAATAMQGGTVAAVTAAGVGYFDAATGTRLWEDAWAGRGLRPATGAPVFAGDRLLVPARGARPVLQCYDRLSGRLEYAIDGAPAVYPAGAGFYALFDRDEVRFFPAAGTAEWSLKLPFDGKGERVFSAGTDPSGTLAVWLYGTGGVFLRNGAVTAAFNDGSLRDVRLARMVGDVLLAVAPDRIVAARADGSIRTIDRRGDPLDYPADIIPLDATHAAVIYMAGTRQRAVCVDTAALAVVGPALTGAGTQAVFFADRGRLFSLSRRELVCHAGLTREESDAAMARLRDAGDAGSALTAARIALARGDPFAGYDLLRPHLGRVPDPALGLAVEEAWRDLARSEFDVIPRRFHASAEGLVAALGSVEQYATDPEGAGAGRDCRWNGPDDLSAEIRIAPAARALVIRAVVRDDRHVEGPGPRAAAGMDAVVVAIDAAPQGLDAPRVTRRNQNLFTLTLQTAGGAGVLTVRRGDMEIALEGAVLSAAIGPAETVYDLSVPWQGLSIDGRRPAALRLTMQAVDNDGGGVKGTLDWTPAVQPGLPAYAQRFLPAYFAELVLD